MKLAVAPLNVTAVAPVKFVPLIVTLVPAGPLVGVKLAIVGPPPTTPVKNAFKTFAVVCWIRASTLNCRKMPGTSSSPQAQAMRARAEDPRAARRLVDRGVRGVGHARTDRYRATAESSV